MSWRTCRLRKVAMLCGEISTIDFADRASCTDSEYGCATASQLFTSIFLLVVLRPLLIRRATIHIHV